VHDAACDGNPAHRMVASQAVSALPEAPPPLARGSCLALEGTLSNCTGDSYCVPIQQTKPTSGDQTSTCVVHSVVECQLHHCTCARIKFTLHGLCVAAPSGQADAVGLGCQAPKPNSVVPGASHCWHGDSGCVICIRAILAEYMGPNRTHH